MNKQEKPPGYLNLAPVGICVLDPDYKIKIWNQCLEDWTGYRIDAVQNQDIRTLIHTFDSNIMKRLELIFSGGPPIILSSLLHTNLFPTKLKYMENQIQHITISSIENDSGKWDAFFVIQDVTDLTRRINKYKFMKKRATEELEERKKIEIELKKAIKEKETLYSELNHRVKNNLTLINSLIELKIASTHDTMVAYSLRDIQNKIFSISVVHEKLTVTNNIHSIDISLYLYDLASKILLGKKNSGKIELLMDIPPFKFAVSKTISLGMIFSEMITNSLKYAFDDNPGTISIHATISSDGIISFVYKDTGPGLPPDYDPETSTSLGMKIIYNLIKQLDGKISYQNENGLKIYIDIPA